jgi:hypothetical protein
MARLHRPWHIIANMTQWIGTDRPGGSLKSYVETGTGQPW